MKTFCVESSSLILSLTLSKGTKAIHDTIHHNKSNNQLYSCKFCLEAATSISEIIQHHKDYHEIQAMPFFQCENCDFVSEKISETRSHSKSVHGLDDYRPYKCKHCELTSDNLLNFARHVKNHNPNRSFICDECGTVLKSAKNLRYHKTSYHKQNTQELVCDICGFATVQMNNLKRHIKAMHEKPEKCQYCENSYGTKGQLISEANVLAFPYSKKPTNYFINFCPSL